jgi:hypothetical protein
MSWFSEILSGGAGARRAAMSRAGQQAVSDFRALGEEYSTLFGPIMEQMSRDRAANIGLYREQMGRAQADYTRYFEQARTEYGTGMQRALDEMRIGRESTIALSRQQTERQMQRASAANAFSGIGQSSFGQGRLEAIGRQGVLQEGAIREQYAGQLSTLEAQRAAGLSGISAQMGQGLANLGQQQAAMLSNIYQSYSGAMGSSRQQALANQFNMYQQGYNISSNYQGQSAQLSGLAWNPASQFFGSALGATANSLFGTPQNQQQG